MIVRRRSVVRVATGTLLMLACFFAVSTLTAQGPEGKLAVGSDAGVFEDGFRDQFVPFLKEFCVDCHSGEEPSGERDFSQLQFTIEDDNQLVDFQDILDQLNLSEMPPTDADQPSAAQRQRMIRWLTERLKSHHASRKQQNIHAKLRRQNAREYRNSVRDLLFLDMTMFDPTDGFPRDQTSEHLDNIGSTLVTSGPLLQRYLQAADQCVTKAVGAAVKPSVQTWTFRDDFRQQPEIDQVHRRTSKFEHMTLYDVVGADKPEGAYGPILAFKEGVPLDGYYEIRLLAEAVNRQHPYDIAMLGVDPNEPFRLGIVPGNHAVGELHRTQPIEPLLAEIELTDDRKWYTVRVWLDKGYTPRFTFQNGLMDVRNLWGKLVNRYKDQFPPRKRPGIVENRFNAIKYGKLPQIHIHEIEIKGPLYDQWPTASQRAVFGDRWAADPSITPTDQEQRQQLRQFAARAYRRPVTDAELERLWKVVLVRRQAGHSNRSAFADGVKAVLCSPHFLYTEPVDHGVETDYALASRLSFFVWASVPDSILLEQAREGVLRQPEVLKKQLGRMLDDPRSTALTNGFLDSWLTLRDLGASPPERSSFRDFYHYGLQDAMRNETRMFAQHLLDENLSIVNFLDSEFSFLNKALARHYGIQVAADHRFRKVELKDPRRGGLLGHASVLTVTANGIDTSPVVRGVWLLDNLLGTPPSPPPPDVEPLDPDIRGAKTIRDQLEKHRSIASCNECHRRIDPLGFALENFDPVGRWRSRYSRQAAVDASGALPNGKKFDDVVGLKQILVQQRDQFARALTSKLLAYAIGRHLGPNDRPQVDEILRRISDKGYGFRDLLEEIVLSETFRRPTVSTTAESTSSDSP